MIDFGDFKQYLSYGKFKFFVHGTPRVSKNNYFLSGVAKIQSKLIWGDNDLVSCSSQTIENQVGNYVYISFDESIRISTDFFGTCKLYYYYTGNDVIVTNRYHLLIYLLKMLNINFEIDYPLFLNYMSMSDICTNQLMTNEGLIKDTYVLPADSIMVLESTGKFHFEKSLLGKILEEETEYTEEDYKKMVKSAAEEIKENIRICYESSRFNRYVVDLTGGMDTRMVIAALSNYKGFMSKTELFTFGAGDDLNRASEISDYLGMRYSPTYQRIHQMGGGNYAVTSNLDPTEYLMLRMSCVVGTDFEPNDGLTDSNVCAEGTLHLTGGSGELPTRPYISMNLNSMTKTTDFASVKKYVSRSKTVFLEESLNTLSEFLYQIIISSKSHSKIMKNEQLLLQRNRYHFDTSWANSFRTPQWQPCQSINAMRIFVHSIDKMGNRKFIYDLLYELSPELMGLPFSSERDNKERFVFCNNYSLQPVNSSPGFNYLLAKVLSTKIEPEIKESNLRAIIDDQKIESWKKMDFLKYLSEESLKLCTFLKGTEVSQVIPIESIELSVIDSRQKPKPVSRVYAIYRRLISITELLDNGGDFKFKEYNLPHIIFKGDEEFKEFLDSNDMKKDYDFFYQKALAYRSESNRCNVTLARYWFEKASISKRKYMVLDYALCLINGTELDRHVARSLILDYVSQSDAQAVRIYGLSLLKEKDCKLHIIGIQLLFRAVELGSPWAKNEISYYSAQ